MRRDAVTGAAALLRHKVNRMFRGQELARPKRLSVFATLIIAVAVLLGSSVSPIVGYLCGLIGLLAIMFASITGSFWPTGNKPENSIVISLFWGVMLGGVVPMIVGIFLKGGFKAVYEMLLS